MRNILCRKQENSINIGGKSRFAQKTHCNPANDYATIIKFVQ
jgi:hypothetical protein